MALVIKRNASCSWSRPPSLFVFLVLVHALLLIGGGGCVSSGSPGDEVLEHLPITPFQPDSRMSSLLAAFYQPSPTGTMRISTTYGYTTFLFALSMPEGNLTKFVEVNAFLTTSSWSRYQSWCRLAVLDFSVLQKPYNNPAYFLPAMAVTPDQQQLVFFGFGPLPQCHNVFIWKYGYTKPREIQTSNGEKVAHALHTIAISETTETQPSSKVNYGAERSSSSERDRLYISREFQNFLILTATSDEFLVRLVTSVRVFRLEIVGGPSYNRVTISEVTGYSSLSKCHRVFCSYWW